MKSAAKERSARLWKNDALWREMQKIKTRICKQRTGRVQNPSVSTEILESRLLSLSVEWKAEQRKQRTAKGESKAARRKHASPEERARNMAVFEANMQRHRDKVAAKAELQELVAAWRKKWAFCLGSRPSKKRNRKLREELIKASKIPGDRALIGQINRILHSPCHCYWCNTYLPRGGTIDHILAVSKGGSHTSGNICAACVSCNSLKSDKTPEQVGLTPTLL